jgi:hypothetical protein
LTIISVKGRITGRLGRAGDDTGEDGMRDHGGWWGFVRSIKPAVVRIDLKHRTYVQDSEASPELLREAWVTLLEFCKLPGDWWELQYADEDDARMDAEQTLLHQAFARLGGPAAWRRHGSEVCRRLRRGDAWSKAIEPFARGLRVRDEFAWLLVVLWCAGRPSPAEEGAVQEAASVVDREAAELMARCSSAPSSFAEYDHVVHPLVFRQPDGQPQLLEIEYRERRPDESGAVAFDVSEPRWR